MHRFVAVLYPDVHADLQSKSNLCTESTFVHHGVCNFAGRCAHAGLNAEWDNSEYNNNSSNGRVGHGQQQDASEQRLSRTTVPPRAPRDTCTPAPAGTCSRDIAWFIAGSRHVSVDFGTHVGDSERLLASWCVRGALAGRFNFEPRVVPVAQR